MKILVLSKLNFDKLMVKNNITTDNVESIPDCFFISINYTFEPEEIPYFSEDKSNVKIMYFDDVETNMNIPIIGTGKEVEAKAFTLEQAKDLLQFIESNKDKDKCYIHCRGGISRSGAVGEFINDYFGGNYNEFKRMNPMIKPNNLILRLLKKASNEYYDQLTDDKCAIDCSYGYAGHFGRTQFEYLHQCELLREQNKGQRNLGKLPTTIPDNK